MSLKIKKSSGAGIHIDEGEYSAVIETIQIKKWEDGGESFAFTFKVKNATLDGDEIEGPVRVGGLATAILTPKSKLSKWAKGAGLDVDSDEIDLEDAIGKNVRIYVEDYETKEGAVVSKVTTVKPSKKKNEEEKGKKSKKQDDDDDDDKPKKKKSKKDDDDDDDKPKKKKSKKDIDEDDDDDKPAKGKAKKEDDDELFDFEDGDEDEDED